MIGRNKLEDEGFRIAWLEEKRRERKESEGAIGEMQMIWSPPCGRKALDVLIELLTWHSSEWKQVEV